MAPVIADSLQSNSDHSLPSRKGGWVSTIGFFDGVHRGHQCLIQQVREEALRRGARSLLVTFDRHPRAVFAPESAPRLLTSVEEKMALLRASGADAIHVLSFDRAMATLSAREFMQQVLLKELGVSALVIGYDHHFGRPQGETFEDYRAMGRELGIDVVLARELEGEHVSSSAIRHALETGDVTTATHLLGRPYTWTGRVVHGHAVGRQLGFPTANLEASEPDKLLPARGAYAVTADKHPAMLNIGQRPTLDNGRETSVEVHLLDYEGDLYGQELTLSFVARLREEHRFGNKEELIAQLGHDQEEARRILKAPAKKRPPRRPFWLYLLIFFFSQLSAAAIPFLSRLFQSSSLSVFQSPLVAALLTANLLAILLFLLFRPRSVTWQSTVAGLRGEKGRRSLTACLMALPAIVLVNLAQEAFFPELPDLVGEDTFLALMRHPLGLLTIAVLGPLSEELLFRGGVQTDLYLRHSDQGKWVPIALSAAIFAFIHLNPAQMPAAFVLGSLLGYAYWWTGSLLAPVCIHVFNNSLACLLSLLMPNDSSLIHALGGPLPAFLLALVCFLALAVPFLMKLHGAPRNETSRTK